MLYKTVNEELPTDSEGTVTPDGSRRVSITITPTSPPITRTPEGSPWSQGSRNGSAGMVNKNFVGDDEEKEVAVLNLATVMNAFNFTKLMFTS